jgi:hypothetical protein
MADNSMSMESQRTRWNVKSAYSSVGRAGDCSCSADISRSLVRFRVGGIFTLLVRVPGGCMFHALSREGHAPHAAKSRCESPALGLAPFLGFLHFHLCFDVFWGGGGDLPLPRTGTRPEFAGSDQSSECKRSDCGVRLSFQRVLRFQCPALSPSV